MKKIIGIFVLIAGILTFLSCEKELRDPKLDNSLTVSAGISSPASGTSYVLLEDNEDAVMATITWSETMYNLTDLASVNYTLQMADADSNFSSSVDLITSTATTFDIIVGTMNNRLLGMGYGPDTAVEMSFRIRSFINDVTTYSDVYSESITLTITPFESVAPPPTTAPSLYIPGDYQGWAPEAAPQIFSHTEDGVYTGYMFMPEGGTYEFKFTTAPDWDHTNFGFGGEGLLDTDAGAGNLSVEGPGGYAVVVDTVALTWTHTPESWGIIGEWLAWEEDIDMEWDAENEYLIVTTDIPDVADNRFKFRANDAWDVNLGAKDPDDGTLEQNGADIPFVDGAGNYTFILDFKTAEPTYQLIKN